MKTFSCVIVYCVILGTERGVLNLRNGVLSLWDDRGEQGNKGQDLGVRLEVGVLLEERDTSLAGLLLFYF